MTDDKWLMTDPKDRIEESVPVPYPASLNISDQSFVISHQPFS
jgi:hypothetical protein